MKTEKDDPKIVRKDAPMLTALRRLNPETLGWLALWAAVALAILVGLFAAPPAHAGDWSLDLKGGLSIPIRTTPDGTYWQEAYDHNTKTFTGTYGVGLNYQHTPALSFQSHYLDLGTSRLKGIATSDENYDHINGRCFQNCNVTYNYRATDSLKGGDLTATYTWQREGISPFVKGGLALLYHRAQFRNTDTGDVDRFNGWIPELELGAGLAYKWAYLELDYFQGMNFGGQNLPISTQQIALFAGVRLPL